MNFPHAHIVFAILAVINYFGAWTYWHCSKQFDLGGLAKETSRVAMWHSMIHALVFSLLVGLTYPIQS